MEMRPAMYSEFYGFSEEPFNVTPDPKFLFLDERYREGLAHLEYGVLYGKGFVLLTGEVGTGKTTLLNALLDKLPPEFTTAFIYSTTMSFVDLLRMIHEDFETGVSGTSEAMLLIELNRFLIRQYQQGKNSVLVFDEAQNLDTQLLEKIRLLSNLEGRKTKLLQIILSGQPELADRLEEPSLRQLRQRIAIRYALAPLTRADTARYIEHRLTIAESRGLVSFTDAAVDRIYEYSRGIPRLVNILCANALLLGFGAGKRKIDGDIIGEVIGDLTRATPRVSFPSGAAGSASARAATAHGPNGGGIPPSDRPWTADEAAAYLRVSAAGLRRLFRSGEIPARRLGRGWRVLREDLDQYLHKAPGPAVQPPHGAPAD